MTSTAGPSYLEAVSRTYIMRIHHVHVIWVISWRVHSSIASDWSPRLLGQSTGSGGEVRIPLRAWMFGVCMRLFCIYVVLCLGSCIAPGRSLSQGVLPSVKEWLRNSIRGKGPEWAKKANEKIPISCLRGETNEYGHRRWLATEHRTARRQVLPKCYFVYHKSPQPWDKPAFGV
jgi:hypothetical protein